MMYATHDAFRRDVERLSVASVTRKHETPSVMAGRANFKNQHLIHHSVEDTDLWPRLRRATTIQPQDLELLQEMEAERARVDPLPAAVDSGSRTKDDGAARHVKELALALGQYVDHEEKEALPVIQSLLMPVDWRGLTRQMHRRQGVRGGSTYVPWVMDGMSVAKRERLLGRATFPGPPHQPTVVGGRDIGDATLERTDRGRLGEGTEVESGLCLLRPGIGV
jgi:hypothetical protein